ncbi:alpha/beta hydrolase [Streptomyces sp. VNUA116]|uniref:alpha/beta fold hydrolase n=1 Tax=Streptomyces sp. VNUA116 TaxID=3062449 RepID=UPI00267442B9|nr:alpha/beta hydrolase [Streptomyces sp. VNUA116]WKU43085.1 alpha/beta hydrolase [Streptomyces sp. VNUA116]
MTSLRAGQVRLNVERLGEPGTAGRPPVVLVHGMGPDSLADYYFTIAAGIAAAGHGVVMYDQRGHGRSERPATGYRLEDFSADLRNLLDALGIHRPAVLVGNSFGGAVAIDFAVRHPHRVDRILLIESAPPVGDWPQRMSGFLSHCAETLCDAQAADRMEQEHGRFVARLARRTRPLLDETTLIEDIAAGRIPGEDGLRSLAVPVLALYGADSALAASAPALERLLPDCRTVIVPGQGHTLLVDAPRTVGALLLGWLREDLSRPARATARTRTP